MQFGLEKVCEITRGPVQIGGGAQQPYLGFGGRGRGRIPLGGGGLEVLLHGGLKLAAELVRSAAVVLVGPRGLARVLGHFKEGPLEGVGLHWRTADKGGPATPCRHRARFLLLGLHLYPAGCGKAPEGPRLVHDHGAGVEDVGAAGGVLAGAVEDFGGEAAGGVVPGASGRSLAVKLILCAEKGDMFVVGMDICFDKRNTHEVEGSAVAQIKFSQRACRFQK